VLYFKLCFCVLHVADFLDLFPFVSFFLYDVVSHLEQRFVVLLSERMCYVMLGKSSTTYECLPHCKRQLPSLQSVCTVISYLCAWSWWHVLKDRTSAARWSAEHSMFMKNFSHFSLTPFASVIDQLIWCAVSGIDALWLRSQQLFICFPRHSRVSSLLARNLENQW